MKVQDEIEFQTQDRWSSYHICWQKTFDISYLEQGGNDEEMQKCQNEDKVAILAGKLIWVTGKQAISRFHWNQTNKMLILIHFPLVYFTLSSYPENLSSKNHHIANFLDECMPQELTKYLIYLKNKCTYPCHRASQQAK